MTRRVLITGANGFVGRHLLRLLDQSGWAVRAALRDAANRPAEIGDVISVRDMGQDTDWREAVRGCDAVVHLAGRVHVKRERARDPLAEFRRVNVEGTRRLAEQCVVAGVERFVFASSAKVHGESTEGRAPFRESDPPAPRDAYGLSKLEAEEALAGIAQSTGLQVAVLRPPLVYGPNVGGNFLRLIRWVIRGIPLPLASVTNRRSLVFVANLASALRCCLEHPLAAGRTFLVSDREDVSTRELIHRIARAARRPARLVPAPPGLLHAAGIALGVSTDVTRLTGTLQVDSTSLETCLGWRPPHALDDGLRATVDWFIERARNDGEGRV